jgi:hypothetical protein
MGFFKNAASIALAPVTGGASLTKAGGNPQIGSKLARAFGVSKDTGQIDPNIANLTAQEEAYQDYLAKQVRGEVPSIAQNQLMMGQQEAFNQAQAMAASNRSVNPALAQRQAQMANAQTQAQVNQQAGLLRAQEQAQATGQMGDFLSQLRQSRLGVAQSNAQAQQQVAQNRAGLFKQLLGSAGQAGAAMATSDENAKENIELGDKEIKSFLDAIKAYKYEYKDKEDGEGEFVSPMAQDLEKSKVGKKMVQEDESGKKMVNYDGHSLGSMLAAQGYMHKKIENIESKLENILKNKAKK